MQTDGIKGGRTYKPYVYSEKGVAMLTSVLHTQRAVEASIQIIEAFVEMSHYLLDNRELLPYEELKELKTRHEMMAKATGGVGEDAPVNKYNVGDKVIVNGYEGWDSTITEVKEYSSNGWRYQILSIRDSDNGHEEDGYPANESEISPA